MRDIDLTKNNSGRDAFPEIFKELYEGLKNGNRDITTGVIKTGSNLGVAATGVTAEEFGDGMNHITKLTVASTLPAIAGGAALSVGKLLYTLPAGAVIIKSAKISMAIQQVDGNIDADTPEVGLGTVIGTGVVAILSTTLENILTGQVANDCDGTAEVKTVADQILVVETAAAHTVHFNVADTWAASGDATAGIVGTVIIEWAYLN